MARDQKMIMSVGLSLLMAVMSTGLPAVYYLGQMSARFESIEQSNGKLQATLKAVMEGDLADVKTRLTIMEQKDILPRAERSLEKINERLRLLEANQGN